MSDQAKQQQNAEQAERPEQQPLHDLTPEAVEQERGGDVKDVKGGRGYSKIVIEY